MKKLLGCMKLMVIMLFALGLMSPAPAATEEIKWVGCGISKKAYMTELARAYENKTGVKIALQGGGATRGIRDVAKGKADLGGSCRHVIRSPQEKNAKLETIAWDALVIIVNPDNPVSNISIDDLKAVFEGKITNWSQLGGQAGPIKVVARKGKESGVGLMSRELLFKDPNFDFTSNALYLKSSGPVEKLVEKESTAIAITGVSSAAKRNVKMLSLNGKSPSQENIASGEYLLYRPLYMVTSRTPSGKVNNFVNFAKSEEGQQIIHDAGTVNLKDGAGLWKHYRKSMKDMRNR